MQNNDKCGDWGLKAAICPIALDFCPSYMIAYDKCFNYWLQSSWKLIYSIVDMMDIMQGGFSLFQINITFNC